MIDAEEQARRDIAEAADVWFNKTFKQKLHYPLSEHQARLMCRAAFARGFILKLEQTKTVVIADA